MILRTQRPETGSTVIDQQDLEAAGGQNAAFHRWLDRRNVVIDAITQGLRNAPDFFWLLAGKWRRIDSKPGSGRGIDGLRFQMSRLGCGSVRLQSQEGNAGLCGFEQLVQHGSPTPFCFNQKARRGIIRCKSPGTLIQMSLTNQVARHDDRWIGLRNTFEL